MKRILAILALLTVSFLWLRHLDESRDLQVTRHTVGQKRPGGVGLRIAQISDLHMVGGDPVEEETLRVVRAEDPDLVVLTGDILTHKDREVVMEDFLQRLPARAQKLAIPGNWEYWAGLDMRKLRRFYARHGVTLLVNDAVLAAGGRLVVVGVDDFIRGEPDWERAMAWFPDWSGPVLTLLHNPVGVDQLPVLEPGMPDRLALAGHTHGGQIVLFGHMPKPTGPVDVTCRFGWCQNKHVPMYVSRGIGTSVLPLRIGARPELPIFEWFF
ncbi:MAG: metallophosphoesterase [Magnetococcales bacterium]|nr:metallophosphoesterase [Magnetococcales bacterium]